MFRIVGRKELRRRAAAVFAEFIVADWVDGSNSWEIMRAWLRPGA